MTYEGALKQGKFHGFGSLSGNNWSYKGDFLDGRRDGQGVLKAKASVKFGMLEYNGGWKNGKKHGQGTLILDELTEMECIWEFDKPKQVLRYSHDEVDDAYDFMVEPQADGSLLLMLDLDGEMAGVP